MRTRESKNKGQRDGRPTEAPITADERFSSVHNDPRFSFPRKKEQKLVVDDRFNGLLQDEDFKQKSIVDRYGRSLKSNRSEKELQRLYHLDKESSEGSESQPESLLVDAARGEGSVSSTDSEDADEDLEENWEQSATAETERIPIGDFTRRFAVVNLDWDHLKASDLYLTLSSFQPTSGKLQSVKIYLSDFGRQKMALEQIAGPPKDLFKTQDEEAENQIIQTDDGQLLDMSKLRQYQLGRLRYYYAIVDCDSIETAKRIYEECDGAEYEASGNFFDIRFVPNDVSFDDKPTDECHTMPVMHEPNAFTTEALQHSKVKLTWDDDDHSRHKHVQKAFSKKDIENMDFKAYLASSESEEDNEPIREKYKSLLKKVHEPRDVDEEEPMQITFEPALANREASGKATSAQYPEQETSIHKYQRKERERRERNRAQRQLSEKQNEEPDHGFHDDFFADTRPTSQLKRGPKKGRKHPDETNESENPEKATNEELKLLMMDEDGTDPNLHHFDLRQIQRAEKARGKKSKHQRKRLVDEIQDSFQVDVSDPRFASLYDEHEFAIDPTNPHYKKTETMEKLLSEKRRRRNKETEGLL